MKEDHNKAAEQHENAAKSHRAAADAHGKNDHAKGKEHSARKPNSIRKTAAQSIAGCAPGRASSEVTCVSGSRRITSASRYKKVRAFFQISWFEERRIVASTPFPCFGAFGPASFFYPFQ